MPGLELLTRAAMETATGLFLHAGSRWSVAELLGQLEEEKAKIVVFQREIPLCVSIVSYVVDSLKAEDKEEEEDGRDVAAVNGVVDGRPVLEEFIPIHRETEEEEKKKNMANWMSSAQLWGGGSDDSNGKDGNNSNSSSSGEVSSTKGAKTEMSRESEPVAEIQDDNKSMGFPIFSGYPSPGRIIPVANNGAAKVHLLPTAVATPAVPVPLPPFSGLLSLGTPTVLDSDPVPDAVSQQRLTGSACFNGENLASQPLNPESDQHHTSARKVRRCWSADLHRKFVHALGLLGGPQVATPKQIRELMKVDGLTNDEVKSHLQKYRLHARKQTTSSTDPQKPDLRLDLWADAESQNPTLRMRSCSSSSPNSHFEFAGPANGSLPTVVADHDPSEDGKSDSYTWDGYSHRSRAMVSG